jgi:hyperosmotically inducible protein
MNNLSIQSAELVSTRRPHTVTRQARARWRPNRLPLVIGLAVLVAGARPATQAPTGTIEGIRKELLQLPYYGVFDFVAFNYDNGTVRLMGKAYSPNLKKDAERAVKRASGVDEVQNVIEELPASETDDALRWKTYYAIYRDPFLSRYAPGSGMLWGHRHPLSGRPLYSYGPGTFDGFEAAGDYPVHIVVQNSRITLLGVVENEADKTAAGTLARGIPGSLGVENLLMIEKARQSSLGKHRPIGGDRQ